MVDSGRMIKHLRRDRIESKAYSRKQPGTMHDPLRGIVRLWGITLRSPVTIERLLQGEKENIGVDALSVANPFLRCPFI